MIKNWMRPSLGHTQSDHEVVSRNGDVNVSGGVMGGDQEGGANCCGPGTER